MNITLENLVLTITTRMKDNPNISISVLTEDYYSDIKTVVKNNNLRILVASLNAHGAAIKYNSFRVSLNRQEKKLIHLEKPAATKTKKSDVIKEEIKPEQYNTELPNYKKRKGYAAASKEVDEFAATIKRKLHPAVQRLIDKQKQEQAEEEAKKMNESAATKD